MNLLIIEGRKLKRSKLLWILIAAILIMWIPCVLNADVNFDMETEGISPENNFFIQGFMGFAWFLFPASIVVITVLIAQTERKNRGLFKMLSLPVHPGGLCLSKFVILLFLLAAEMLFMVLGYFLSAEAASGLENYDFSVDVSMVLRTAGLVYLASVPMAALYYMLSVLITSSVFSVGIGLALIVPSVLVMNTKAWFVYPPCYPFRIVTAQMHDLATKMGSFDYELVPWIPAAAVITVLCIVISCIFFGRGEVR